MSGKTSGGDKNKTTRVPTRKEDKGSPTPLSEQKKKFIPPTDVSGKVKDKKKD